VRARSPARQDLRGAGHRGPGPARPRRQAGHPGAQAGAAAADRRHPRHRRAPRQRLHEGRADRGDRPPRESLSGAPRRRFPRRVDRKWRPPVAVSRPPSRPLLATAALAALLAGCGDDLPGPGGGDAAPDGDLVIEGLSGPVTVHFDEHGVLHARCESEADCFMVEGYFHAAHRFVQMDIRRRLGRGRLSRLAGPVTLPTDMRWRQMMATTDGDSLAERLLASADERTRAALEAYSAGVNAWLADLAAGENGAVLADEYSFDIIDASA